MTADQDILLDVVEALAEVEGVEPHELEYTLHEHVYTEAIRGLVEGEYAGWELTFQVPGHEVSLREDREIYVDGTLVRERDVDQFERIE